jgi:rhamnosyltransferase
MISVVIPVKDGGEGFAQCLDGIRRQLIDEPVEIVVVDSGSADDSVGVALGRDARVYEIAAREFSHGASRNLGCRQARGELLVFLSQDAIPEDQHWLRALTAPLRGNSELAGAYGRQLAHPSARPPERYFLDFLYGPTPRLQSAPSVHQLSMETTLFSNVNAAMPRAMWERFPFAQDIVMSEDQEWSGRVLLAGYSLAYEPAAAVRHSHDYTLKAAFRRFFDSGMSSDRAYMAGQRESSRVLRSTAVRYALGELRWLWRTGQRRWIPYAAVYESAKMLGLVLGANHEALPAALRRRFTGIPSGWEASQRQSGE